MPYCHICSWEQKATWSGESLSVHWKQRCWWQWLANLADLGIRAHSREKLLLLLKTPHMPELWPLPAFQMSSFCFSCPAPRTSTSDMSLRPQGQDVLLPPLTKPSASARQKEECRLPPQAADSSELPPHSLGQRWFPKLVFGSVLHPELRPARQMQG